jgi:hypothetical protein
MDSFGLKLLHACSLTKSTTVEQAPALNSKTIAVFDYLLEDCSTTSLQPVPDAEIKKQQPSMSLRRR